MAAELIDGKTIAEQIREEVRRDVAAWVAGGGPVPRLAVVLVGDDAASASYVRGKQKACEAAGIRSETLRFDAELPESELLALIHRLNADASVHGILVQLPLPAQIDEHLIIRAMNPDKDVDGFHPENAGRLVIGQPGFVPATPAGVIELLRRSGVQTVGAHAVVVGRSNIVGRPLANLLSRKGIDATVTVCHSRTRDLPAMTRSADILIAAIGSPHFIRAEMVMPGATVIDVGVNRVEDPSHARGYRLVGDVDFESVCQVAGRITPVPGGVGPMTIALLLKNTLVAARGLTA